MIEYMAYKNLGPKTREYKANAWRKLYEGMVTEVLPEIANHECATVKVEEAENERMAGGLTLRLNVTVWHHDTGS